MNDGVTRARLEDFVGGWIVGDFSPSIFKSRELEVGLKILDAGYSEPEHFQRKATEVTLVIEGECWLNGEKLRSGDIMIVPPGIAGEFYAKTNTTLLVLKAPSLPKDKVLGRVEIAVE
jgi:quercetin dioxygenase-like cupin family protein